MNQYFDLIKAIDDANIPLARSIIIGYANQSVKKITGALDVVNSRTLNIFEPNDELLYPINSDVTSWDEDYWHGLTSDMMHNFSKERLKHLFEVVKAMKAKPEIVKAHDVLLDDAVKQKLDVLIHESNLERLRSELVGILNVEAKKALKAFIYSVEKKPELLQNHDEDLYPIDDNENSWDDNYWHGLTSDMMHNFSKERFEHMLKVRQYLDREDVQDTSPQEESVRSNENDDKSTEGMGKQDNTLTYILIAAGIVIAIPVVLWLLFKS